MKFQEYVGYISIGQYYYNNEVQISNDLHSASWAKLCRYLELERSFASDHIRVYPPSSEGHIMGVAHVTKMDDRTYYFSIDTFNKHSMMNAIIEVLKFYFGGEWKKQIVQNAYVVSIGNEN